jgi:lipopolysaccharide export system permease protein
MMITRIATVMAVLMGLTAFIEFVGQLDDIGVGDFGIPQALLFAAMRLPGKAFVMLPMAALLGTLLGLGSLASNSELTALRAAGVSIRRLAGAVASTGVVLALLTLFVGEYVAPPLDQYSRHFRTFSQHGQSGVAMGPSAWIRERDVIINVNPLQADGQAGGVYLFHMDPNGQLAGIGRADSAVVDGTNQWVLNNYAETVITDSGVEVQHRQHATQSTTLHPDLMQLTVVRPRSMDGLMLYRYVKYLEQNGLDARQYIVAFWGRFASSAAVIPMCVLALPFVFGNLRNSGAGSRMAIGIVIGLGYFLANRVLSDGGELYALSPVLVAWLPTVVLSVCVLIALNRVR